VPDNEILCELLHALFVTSRLPVEVPDVAVGVYVTSITQLPPPAPLASTIAPLHVVLASAKGPLPMLIAEVGKISGVVPVLVTVIFTVLVLPFVVVGKVSLPELNPIALKLATGLITYVMSGTSIALPPCGVMTR
jgi:hypothetical protein